MNSQTTSPKTVEEYITKNFLIALERDGVHSSTILMICDHLKQSLTEYGEQVRREQIEKDAKKIRPLYGEYGIFLSSVIMDDSDIDMEINS